MIDPTDPGYLDPAKNEFYKRKIVEPYLRMVMDHLRIEEESRLTLVQNYVAHRNSIDGDLEEAISTIWERFMEGFEEFASRWNFYNKLEWKVGPQKREDVLREKYGTIKE